MFVCAECGQRYDRGGYCANDSRAIAETSDPLLGAELGRYRLASLLGEGGMGQVYLGVQPTIGSRVAIKVLSDQCARMPELLDRFFAEARAVNLIRHECIVSVIDMAKLDDGRPYIVMEYIEGQTLGPLVRGTPAPLGGVVQVMSEVCSALAAAHAIGIVHRDLKPDNILVTIEGHAKVLDFGIAKLSPGLSHLSPRTRTGALLGTPAYMAPEQISGGGTVDARSDVYAAGIVLFEAVTGRIPFDGETLFDLMKQHLDMPPPPPRSWRPDLPVAMEQVITTALAKSPAQRFQSIAAMADALSHASSELPSDQWRALSRGGPITGGRQSVTRVRSSGPRPIQPTGEPTVASRPASLQSSQPTGEPTAPNRREIKPTGEPMVSRPEARWQIQSGDPTVASRSTALKASPKRRWLAIALAMIAVAALAVAITWRVLARREPELQQAAIPAEPGEPVAVPGVTGPGIVQNLQPHVVGGGSAADHGVKITGNVHMNPGVTITSTKKARALVSSRADFDPKRFDPIAYLPKARAAARELLDDAEFTEFEMYENVRPDGFSDLTLPTSSTSYYEFRSRLASKRAGSASAGCYVMVYLTATHLESHVREDTACDHPIRGTPHCKLAEVVALAHQPADAIATVGFLSDGKWFFDLRPAVSPIRTFGDCP